jgi:hypothetical protein
MTQISAAEIKAFLWSAPAWRSAVKKLYVQVLIAIAAGILLGAVWPSLANEMKLLSDAFITLIRAVVPPIIFATVAVGIAKMGDMRRVGVVGLPGARLFRGGLDNRAGGRVNRRQSVAAGRRSHRSRLAR